LRIASRQLSGHGDFFSGMSLPARSSVVLRIVESVRQRNGTNRAGGQFASASIAAGDYPNLAAACACRVAGAHHADARRKGIVLGVLRLP
jgi:hypothetical protein